MMKNYTSSYPASPSDLSPCCYISEGGWTWLAITLLSVSLFMAATLKYYKKVLDKDQGNVKKKEKVLKRHGLARERGAKTVKLPEGPVSIDSFKQGIQNRTLKPAILRIEFSFATKRAEVPSMSCGQLPGNKNKNRDPAIIPFDYNRVVLEDRVAMEDSNRVVLEDRVAMEDYVNASFVDDLVGGPGYIVAQGPLKHTVHDFWEMVWQQNVEVVVMLTRTFDFIKVECVQYWPPGVGHSEVHGRLSVTMVKEIKFANYVQRILTVFNTTDRLSRTVTQFHYTEWPAYARPRIGNLLEFRKKVALLCDKNSLLGPCLVHCNNGAGRSGVYIQVDSNMRFAHKTNTLNIFGYLKILREQRPCLVETEEQYRLIYNILEEHIMIGDTSLLVDRFLVKLKQLRNTSGEDLEEGEKAVDSAASFKEEMKEVKKTVDSAASFKEEMKEVARLVPELTMGDCAGGHMPGNRQKNRHALIVPPDSHRPYITSFQGNECTDYVNAVFVNGFKQSNEFIVTEWPTNDTLGDFWSLIYDHNVKTVVVLDNPTPSYKFPAFWPNSGCNEKYGSIFQAKSVESDTSDTDWNLWRINLHKEELAPHRMETVSETQGKKMSSVADMVVYLKDPIKTCILYQMTSWPGGRKVPTNPQSIIRMVARARGAGVDTHMVVVSKDGCDRVGVFCVASCVKDKLERDAEIDVMSAVRNVKTNRPQLLDNMEEYKFCYDVAEQLIINDRRRV